MLKTIRQKRWFKTLKYIFQRYNQANCSIHAASLTLDTLLSLVPFLATSIALFAALPFLQHFIMQAEQKLLGQIIFDTGHNVSGYLQKLTKQAATVSFIGAIALLVTNIKLLYSLNQAFQAMLSARIRQKSYLEIIVSCLAWIMTPILVGLGIAVSSFIVSLPFLAKYKEISMLMQPLLRLLSILLDTIGFSFLYIVAPLFIVPKRNVILGALCAAILFEISKALFGLYIRYFPTYQALYGALAAIPLFLLWLYVSWQIALLGAIIAQALSYKDRYRSDKKLDGFTHAICWLGYFQQAKDNNQTLTMNDLIKKDTVSYQVEPETMLEKLKDLGFIAFGRGGQYFLEKDVSNINLDDCFQILPWKSPQPRDLEQLEFSWKTELLNITKELTQNQHAALDKPLKEIYKTGS